MMFSNGMKIMFLGVTLTALSGCGGNTTSAATPPPKGTNPPASAPPPAAVPVTLANTTAGSSAVSMLLLDTGTLNTGFAGATFTHAASQVRAAGSNYGISPNGNRYIARVNAGGNNRVVALETAAGAMPSSGGATYTGTANMEYVDTRSGNTFRGTLDATVTADFVNNSVDIDLTNPSGTFGGVAYAGPGRVDIDNLAISGARYSSVGGSSGSVTGFTGATGLNSGAQTIDASGVFAGPTAEETGATAVISDGVNGQAVLDLIGSQ